VIRHALLEGWSLLRERSLISAALALALAVPVALAGLTLSVRDWLGPLATGPRETTPVSVLLRPTLEPEQVEQWLQRQRSAHPEWRFVRVQPEELASRLGRWFPYVDRLLEPGAVRLLPPLVEVEAPSPSAVAALDQESHVLAVGPTSSVQDLLQRLASRLGWVLTLVTATLLACAVLLAAVWVHLELYRHADELTIMRLVGATEAAIRGPFLLAAALPGLLAGALASATTVILSGRISTVLETLGLPPLETSSGLLLLEIGLALCLPVLAAAFTLARHAALELDS
jgi:cell division transport system permease protein